MHHSMAEGESQQELRTFCVPNTRTTAIGTVKFIRKVSIITISSKKKERLIELTYSKYSVQSGSMVWSKEE